ncbi:MAG TPA: hypothetical protein VFX16_17625 [Pseudonocardiaceae bacterium]|nr:hypothetical protein [Pseudonocardiaceae bacterium]
MPSVNHSVNQWETIAGAGLGLNVVQFDVPIATYDRKSDGAWLYLEGFRVVLGDDEYRAHITITKPPTKKADSDEWTYCHLTVDRAKDPHVFYEVASGGAFHTTTVLLNREGKQRQAKDHFPGSRVNDPALVREMEHDMRLIFQYIA